MDDLGTNLSNFEIWAKSKVLEFKTIFNKSVELVFESEKIVNSNFLIQDVLKDYSNKKRAYFDDFYSFASQYID